MSEEPQTSPDTRHSGASWTHWLAIPLLFLAYLLSIGPVVRLVEEKFLPQGAVFIYEPLRVVCSGCDPVMKAFAAYVELWRKR